MDDTNQVQNQQLGNSNQDSGNNSSVPTSMPKHKIEEHMLFVAEHKAKSEEKKAEGGEEEKDSVILGTNVVRTPESLDEELVRDESDEGDSRLRGNDESDVQNDNIVQDDMVSDSGMSKEAEPMPSLSPDIAEIVKATETPVELEPDVEAAGVKEVQHAPKLTQQDISAGIQAAKESVPVGAKYTPPATKLQVAREDAEQATKKPLILQDASQSDVWLKLLWLKYYEMSDKKEHEDKNI
jgi:hypothetical protein